MNAGNCKISQERRRRTLQPMTAAARRLQSLKSLLAHLRERLGLDLGFVLWDGTTVPGRSAADALALAIADEGAVAALIRRPKLDTLFNLLVSARARPPQRHAVRPDDAAAARAHEGFPEDARQAARARAPRRGSCSCRAAGRGRSRSARRQGRPRRQRGRQQGQHPVPLRPLERVLRALSRSGDGLYLRAISPSRTTTSPARSATSST